MSTNHDVIEKTSRSWLDRLSQALLREPQDRAELVELLRDAENRQLLATDTLSMLESVLQFSEMHVRDIMIPRQQMVVIEHDAEINDILPTVVSSGHSRFPVMSEDKNHVSGILHAKDLLKHLMPDAPEVTLNDLARPAVMVPESKRLEMLLKEFRENRNHMAIVVDEYGNVSGFVTIEDLLEQIVGDIEDEFDIEEDAFVKKHRNGTYIIKAHMPIEEFNEYFDCQFNEEEFDTIGGLIINAFGHLPKRGESVDMEPFTFKVLNADNRRVRLIRAIRQ